MKKLLLLALLVLSFTSCEKEGCTQPALCQLVSSQDYGKVADTKHDKKMIICHKGNTIEINKKDWKDHEKHGDTKGECTLSSTDLEFRDGEVVKIPCGYSLPFIHTTSNGTQWWYSNPRE